MTELPVHCETGLTRNVSFYILKLGTLEWTIVGWITISKRPSYTGANSHYCCEFAFHHVLCFCWVKTRASVVTTSAKVLQWAGHIRKMPFDVLRASFPASASGHCACQRPVTEHASPEQLVIGQTQEAETVMSCGFSNPRHFRAEPSASKLTRFRTVVSHCREQKTCTGRRLL